MKAVLVFCEGRHDAVFAQRSLGVHGGCQWVGRAIGKLPSPFGPSPIARRGLIATRIERHAIEDLTKPNSLSTMHVVPTTRCPGAMLSD